jgi:deoxyribose-phosphate aldolase
MYIEYAHYDLDAKDSEITETINAAAKYDIQSISVFYPYIKLIKSQIDTNKIQIASSIDFPLGIMDANSRMSIAANCFKNGASIIDVVCPVHYLCNRKYDKFRDDIKNMQIISMDYNGQIRYILEYRKFTYELLYKVSQILLDLNIKTVFPSTGYFLDDISDNILAAALINKRVPDINIVCNGNVWNESHAKLVKNSKIYGLRLNSINGLKLIANN